MVRAGAHALTLLSVPLNVQVLTALEDGPMALTDLRRATGSPPQTTTRKQLRALTELGVLERRQQPGFPGSVDYQLTRPGLELLQVARVAQSWLGAAPDGPLELGSPAAKNSIKALVDGWTSALVRALAARPLSLTELSRLITTMNYPSLERRLAAMRLTGQLEAYGKPNGRSRLYAPTSWLRHATAPLAAAAAWERRFRLGAATGMVSIDVQAFFLLALQLLSLGEPLAGTARLAVELRDREGRSGDAGTVVRVADGEITSCTSRLEGRVDGWATGSVGAWLGATIGGEVGGLEIGGDSELAHALVGGLHRALFGEAEAALPEASSSGSFY